MKSANACAGSPSKAVRRPALLGGPTHDLRTHSKVFNIVGFKQRVAFGVLVVLAGSRLQGSQSQFKGGVGLVRLDVAVIDNRTGQPVTGLAASDFIVREKGRPQAIASFVAETGDALGGGGDGTGGHRRSFLFILGTGLVEGTSDPYGRLAQFLRTSLRPDDRAAVMAWDCVTKFTNDRDALAGLVDRRRRVPGAVMNPVMRDIQQRRGFSDESRRAIREWLIPPGQPADFLRPVATYALGGA